MLRLLPLALLLVPTAAAAWAVHVNAPSVAGAGLPFVVRVCAQPDKPVEAVEVKAGLDAAARYVRAGPDGCADVSVQPDDEEGDVTLTARARPAGGSARATAFATVHLVRAPVVVLPSGVLVPRLDDGLPPALALEIESAWGPPYSGIVLRNAGEGEAPLRAVGLPDATLAPGARVFLGERAPPGLDLVPFAKPKPGLLTLRAARLAVASFDVPKLAPGEVADREGVHRAGRTAIVPRWIASNASLEAWATPDAGAAPVVRFIDGAREEVLLEAYELDSPDVAAALGRALDRGVAVRMLLEGAPVGGVRSDEAARVAALAARGADARFLRSAEGFPTRYATMHAKVIVADRAAVLVSTDNFRASSYPAAPDGSGTRGFGLVAREPALALALAQALEADLAPWPDAQPVDLAALPPPATLAATAGAANGTTFAWQGEWRGALALSPDAPDAVVDLIRGAQRSVDVAMLFAEPRFKDRENPLLQALVDAARRNVSVRLLLDGHVDEGRNRAAVERLDALAARERLPLVARVDAAPRTMHAKVALVDGARAYVGSMNWGRAAMEENREAGLVVEAPPVVGFYAGVFARDWQGEEDPPSPRETPLAAWVAALAVVTATRLRRPRPAPSRS